MDRILMRHDDVNTFGVVLYTRYEGGNMVRLYKDKECTQLVTVEEGKECAFKVAYISLVNDLPFEIYCKPVAVVFGDVMVGFTINEPDSGETINCIATDGDLPQNDPN